MLIAALCLLREEADRQGDMWRNRVRGEGGVGGGAGGTEREKGGGEGLGAFGENVVMVSQ